MIPLQGVKFLAQLDTNSDYLGAQLEHQLAANSAPDLLLPAAWVEAEAA